MSAAAVVVGSRAGAHLRIAVWSYAHPGGLSVFDHNWLFAELVARTDQRAFRCHAFLRAPDFSAFARELAELEGGAADRARLAPRDPWVTIFVAGGAAGVWRADVRARDGGSERAVAFSCELDRPALERLRDEVAAVARRFPERP